MNGVEAEARAGELNPASRDCVALLERYLAEARCGKLVFVGVVSAYGPHTAKSEFCGSAGLHMEANLACDVLKSQILTDFMGSLPKSPILPGSPKLVVPR